MNGPYIILILKLKKTKKNPGELSEGVLECNVREHHSEKSGRNAFFRQNLKTTGPSNTLLTTDNLSPAAFKILFY